MSWSYRSKKSAAAGRRARIVARAGDAASFGVGPRLSHESLDPLLVGVVALLLDRRNIEVVGFVVLHAEPLDDAADAGGGIGDQVFVGHPKRRDVMEFEPPQPPRVLQFDLAHRFGDQLAIVAQQRSWTSTPLGRPLIRLQRLGHRDRLGDLVATIDVDVGDWGKRLEQRRIFLQEGLELVKMRLHAEDAVPRSAVGNQLGDIVGVGIRPEASHQGLHLVGRRVEDFARRAEQTRLRKEPGQIGASGPGRGGDDVGLPQRRRMAEVEAFVAQRAGRFFINVRFRLHRPPVQFRGRSISGLTAPTICPWNCFRTRRLHRPASD